MKLTFLGAAETVTGSCFLLETDHIKLLIDCGMFQGGGKDYNSEEFSFNPEEIDFLLLSHAHIDHSGLIPKLVKDGFAGEIYATSPTVDLCGIMLPDSGYIQEMEAEWENRKRERQGKPLIDPLYTAEDAYNCFNNFQETDYNQLITLSPEIAFRFHDAGHILGSSIVEIWVTEGDRQQKLVFSGDLGQPNQPIIKDPAIIEEADYLMLESTYGTRTHENEDERSEKLVRVINETMERGGNLIIPSFAVGRTQDLLYEINKLFSEERLTHEPDIFVDSPLAISATEIFRRHPQVYDIETKKFIMEGDSPFDSPYVAYTRETRESVALNEKTGGSIIISASGMAEAGRIKHHLKHNLWREKATVLFVGFQAQHTLGRRIRDGAEQVRIFGEQVAVNCHVEAIDGFSAHADRDQLINWVNKFLKKPKRVFLVHGEGEVIKSFAETLQEQTGLSSYIPQMGECVKLTDDVAMIAQGSQPSLEEKVSYLLEQWELEATLIEDRLHALQDVRESQVSIEELDEIETQMRKLRRMLRTYRRNGREE